MKRRWLLQSGQGRHPCMPLPLPGIAASASRWSPGQGAGLSQRSRSARGLQVAMVAVGKVVGKTGHPGSNVPSASAPSPEGQGFQGRRGPGKWAERTCRTTGGLQGNMGRKASHQAGAAVACQAVSSSCHRNPVLPAPLRTSWGREGQGPGDFPLVQNGRPRSHWLEAGFCPAPAPRSAEVSLRRHRYLN